jgi:chromatin assembly factor 1 subunit B
MKAKVVQIVWHGKEPIFSVDFHRSGLLATGGADKDVKVRAAPLPCSRTSARSGASLT